MQYKSNLEDILKMKILSSFTLNIPLTFSESQYVFWSYVYFGHICICLTLCILHTVNMYFHHTHYPLTDPTKSTSTSLPTLSLLSQPPSLSFSHSPPIGSNLCWWYKVGCINHFCIWDLPWCMIRIPEFYYLMLMFFWHDVFISTIIVCPTVKSYSSHPLIMQSLGTLDHNIRAD